MCNHRLDLPITASLLKTLQLTLHQREPCPPVQDTGHRPEWPVLGSPRTPLGFAPWLGLPTILAVLVGLTGTRGISRRADSENFLLPWCWRGQNRAFGLSGYISVLPLDQTCILLWPLDGSPHKVPGWLSSQNWGFSVVEYLGNANKITSTNERADARHWLRTESH